MKTKFWIMIIIGVVILSLIVGSQLFPKKISEVKEIDSMRFTIENIGLTADYLGHLCDARLPISFIKGETVICDGRIRDIGNWGVGEILCSCVSYSGYVKKP